MPTLQASLAFFTVALLLALSPGPDNLFVLVQSATGGRRAGFAVVAGLMLGVMVHTLAVALGLAAVFATSATAFTVLKLLGAAYLLYLAWGAWRAPAMLVASDAGAPAHPPPWPRLMARGVVMNLTNPKVVLFFLALLPQFVQTDAGPVHWQIVQLGALFMLATLLVFGGFAWVAAWLGGLLRGSARAQRWLNRGASLVFAGMAIKLLLSQR